MEGNINENKILKMNIYIMFILYILILFKIIIFKYSSLLEIIQGKGVTFRNLNLIPLKMFHDFYVANENGISMWSISNTFGNLIVFIPLGYLLPMVYKKIKSPSSVIIITVGLSLILEGSQYVFSLGSGDIDDIILNTAGGIVGFLVCKNIKKILDSDKNIYIATIILAITFCISGFIVAKEEFGNMLGITNFKEEIIGAENLSRSKPDFNGTFISGREDEINMYDGIILNKNTDITQMNKVKLIIDSSTKLYSLEDIFEKNKIIKKYNEISTLDLENIEKNSVLNIWGVEAQGEINAKVIVFQKPVNLEGAGDLTTGGVVDNSSEKEVTGNVFEKRDNGIIIRKQEDITDNSNDYDIAVSTDNKVEINYKDDTRFIIKKINTEKGTSEEVDGTKEDIKINSLIRIVGSKKERVYDAREVIIYEYNTD